MVNDTKVQVEFLNPSIMVWEIVMALSIVGMAYAFSLQAKRIEHMRKDLDNVMTLMRISRHNALSQFKERNDDAREEKE